MAARSSFHAISEIEEWINVDGHSPTTPEIVVGLDVGDRKSHYCRLDSEGVVTAEGSVLTKASALRSEFGGRPWMRLALEAGGYSPWISRLLTELGHEVIVANARNLRMISNSDGKNDRADARMLARLARVGPDLLSPIEHRSKEVQAYLSVIRAREVAVATRTKLINAVRGFVKTFGQRLPSMNSSCFAKKARTGAHGSCRKPSRHYCD